ncbi:MAG: sensor domain-containing diguanylate cyclase [Deltaproteobacteria bacterium]|nr:sensor domain-containing diguanylate cyclase [Deltaproteobacteria bacterium]
MTVTLEKFSNIQDVLQVIKTGILIIGIDYRLLFVNQAAMEIIDKKWPAAAHETNCFSFIFGRTEPCEECLLRIDPLLTAQQKSTIIKKKDGSDVFIRLQIAPYAQYRIITLLDITREVSLLRRIDLTRKEQQARNVLLERRRQEAFDKQHQLQELFDHLPEALLTVDEEFTIEQRNRAVTEVLTENAEQKCYQLLGHDVPCDECPAANGFTNLDDVKKVHQLGERYVTESICHAPFGAGGLLLFRDTTRQIKLIEKIRQQRQTLTSLAELGTLMQKESDLESVIDHFWNLFLQVLQRKKGILVVNDIRPGNIWLVSHRQVDSEETLKKITRTYMSREFQSLLQCELPWDILPWPETAQIALMGRNERLAGLLLFEGEVKDREEKELVDLFTEPLGAYIDNRLLSRKLEEKANTDPLTGLYNRGYLEQALLEEKEKLEKFHMDFALIVADVNRLKKANDEYGHEAGDRLIMTVSELLHKTVRTTDILARTGGDEFVILLSDCNADRMRNFIERLTDKVFHEIFLEVGDNERFPVTVSFGGSATDVCAFELLMQEADKAMYAAKEAYYQREKRYR